MSNDRTRKVGAEGSPGPGFLQQFSVTLVVVEGGAEGTEYAVEQPRTVLGRGSSVDLNLQGDDSVSKHHAAIEVGAAALRVVDLGSTNGTYVNDQRTERAELKHGDRVKVGEHVLQLLIEPRARGPKTFQVD